MRARHSKRSSYTEPVSARARVNDLKQLVITSKCKGGGSRVDVCRVNSSGENAQRVLGVDSVAKYTIEEGYGDRDDGSPGVLTGGEFAPHDFSAIGAEEELHDDRCARYLERDCCCGHCKPIEGDGLFRRWWDAVQVLLLLYVALMVPLRTGFDTSNTMITPLSGLWWLELLVDV